MATQLHTEIIPEIARTAPRPAAKLRTKKKLLRRTDRDFSQALRRGFQFAFLIMNVYLGGVFYLWVRQFEPGGHANALTRPSGVEGWLPIAGMMNLKYFLLTHRIPALHPAAMFLLVTFASIAFLFRKAFCSWLCPVGTLSEYLWQVGKENLPPQFPHHALGRHSAARAEIPLAGIFRLGSFHHDPRDIESFMRSPYGIIADVKMLNFFRTLGMVGAIVLAILVVASVLVQNFWCRYLCPYGALLGLTSLFSPMRIRRDENALHRLREMRESVPLRITRRQTHHHQIRRVHRMPRVRSGLPAQGALRMSLPVLNPAPGRTRVTQSRRGPWPQESQFCFSESSASQKRQGTGPPASRASPTNNWCPMRTKPVTPCPETSLEM